MAVRNKPDYPASMTARAEANILRGLGMSAFRGKADINHQAAECPLIARSGHSSQPAFPTSSNRGPNTSAHRQLATYSVALSKGASQEEAMKEVVDMLIWETRDTG